jgi:antitoxin (DNA-binding transcriptional repressor) of toxin-antitoxin stability system
VRELRDNLSRYLRRVRKGELLVITDHGKPIGEIAPTPARGSEQHARALVRRGLASWSGGKPKGLRRPPVSKGGRVSEAVIEDRR